MNNELAPRDVGGALQAMTANGLAREEAVKILAILKAAYPNAYRGMTKEDAQGVIAVWCSQFAKIPADIVFLAVQKIIAKNTFPPSIAEIKDEFRNIHLEADLALRDERHPLTENERARLEYYRRITEGFYHRCGGFEIERVPRLVDLVKSYEEHF